MFLNLLIKVLTPLTGKLFEMLFGLIAKAVDAWVEERKQDELDRRVKREIKNPDRRIAAGDLDRSFDE